MAKQPLNALAPFSVSGEVIVDEEGVTSTGVTSKWVQVETVKFNDGTQMQSASGMTPLSGIDSGTF